MDADELKLLRESVARLSSKETRRKAIQEGARNLANVSIRTRQKSTSSRRFSKNRCR